MSFFAALIFLNTHMDFFLRINKRNNVLIYSKYLENEKEFKWDFTLKKSEMQH